MKASTALLLLGTAGCLPELEPKNSDANGSEIGETCTSIGVNPNVADLEGTDEDVLAAYNAAFATRLSIGLPEGSSYISGEVTHLDTGERGNLTCVTGETGAPCEVDLYTEDTEACANLAGNWVVEFNVAPTEATAWYLGRDGEEPTLTLDETELLIKDPSN